MLKKNQRGEYSMKKILFMCAALLSAALLSAQVITDWKDVEKGMVKMDSKGKEILATEVTQGLYKSVMGELPFVISDKVLDIYPYEDDIPVVDASWFDAIYFCNKLSKMCGLEPVYRVKGMKDVEDWWPYEPHKEYSIEARITMSPNANGYRLPTVKEWRSMLGDTDLDIDKVAWYRDNFGGRWHPAAQKEKNCYGLYDMIGSLREWCWDTKDGDLAKRQICGTGYGDYEASCRNKDFCCYARPGIQDFSIGFRIVREVNPDPLSKF